MFIYDFPLKYEIVLVGNAFKLEFNDSAIGIAYYSTQQIDQGKIKNEGSPNEDQSFEEEPVLTDMEYCASAQALVEELYKIPCLLHGAILHVKKA